MATVRVYELAKELGVESKVILARLGDIGEFVRSASSTLEAPIVRRLKAEIGTPTRVAPADHDVDETAQVLGIDLQAFRNQKRGSASRTKSRRGHTGILQNGRIDEKAVTARWASRWIDQRQMHEWRKAGLGVYDDAIAAKCITEGITPDQLRTRIDGQTVASRLRGGESVSSIAIRLRAMNDA